MTYWGKAVSLPAAAGGSSPRALVVIPTYNEVENIEPIVERTLAAAPAADVLIVDDASPDGTGEVSERMAEEHEPVHVLHRAGKQGLGAAYVDGFRWAMARDYAAVVEMDADGSHAPEQLPQLLGGLDDADLVVGSRWVPGGRVENWPFSRELLSRGGNAYVRRALGLPLRDATGGFRAVRTPALRSIELAGIQSRGYCFQVDLANRLVAAGFRTAEVPIVFRDRERGTSKMTARIVLEALWRVSTWALERRVRSARRAFA